MILGGNLLRLISGVRPGANMMSSETTTARFPANPVDPWASALQVQT